MNRKEFLDTLRLQLSGEVSKKEVEENIRYYDGYIRDAARWGKSEAEVIEEIGSPVFIARAIIDKYKAASGGQRSGSSQPRRERSNNERPEGGFHTFHMRKGMAKWLVIAVIGVVLIAAISLIGSAIALLARFFIPILIIVLVVVLFKGRRRR